MNKKLIVALLLSSAMILGCKKKEEDKATPPTPTPEVPKTEEPEPEPTPTPEVAQEKPTFGALIIHKVADFDKWKVAFDAHMAARKDAGLLGHHLSRDAQDPNLVTIYMPGTDVDKFEQFATSDDLKKVMQEAGVEGEPTIIKMKTVVDEAIIDRELPGMIIMHEVEDFDKWKTVYDEFGEARSKAGIIGHAVERDLDNENMVIVLHQAEKAEALSTFAASPELKEAMAKAGVKGEPRIVMVNSLPTVMY